MQTFMIVFMHMLATVSAFGVVSRSATFCSSCLWNTLNQEDDGIFYDDFESPIGGGEDLSIPGSSALQNRLSQMAATEQASQLRVSKNWKQGYWSVRGCSLDRGDTEFGEKGVQISSMVSLEDELILVGRTDGSICWLQVGSEYMATFTNQLTANEGANNTISIGSGLRRDELASVPMPRDTILPSLAGEASKFQILAQLQASSALIVDMAVIGEHSKLFVLSDSLTEPLRVFSIQEDGPVSTDGISLPVSPEMTPIVAVQAVHDTDILSISSSGAVCRWSANSGETVSMLSSFQMSLENDDNLICCDADDDFVYFGTSSGSVWIYSVDHILNSQNNVAEPLKVFSSFANAGVSSICAVGEGLMGKGRSTRTRALLTGSTDGDIKQWEILPRGTDAVEYWPKLARQTMPGKAHLLQGGTQALPVLDLRKVNDGVVLSATQGQLAIWDSATGAALSTMQGLNFDLGASCLVLSQHLLVTNGMSQYVCVHDFSIDPDLQVKDMLAPMDDEDE